MALISDLVLELSVMSGIPQETVAVVARHLREAGLLSQKGRGRGAAKATALDAARLCIGLLVGGKAKNAPVAVSDFGALAALLPRLKDDEEFADLTLADVAGLEAGHRFEDALAALINVWRNSSLVERLAAYAGPKAARQVMSAELTISSVTGFVSLASARYMYTDAELARAAVFAQRGEDLPEEFDISSEAAFKRIYRYFSGIRISRGLSAAELRPLGEVVADLRAPGHRDQAESWTQIISGNPEFLRRALQDPQSVGAPPETDPM